jgi:exopolysaccharide production protein ExoY
LIYAIEPLIAAAVMVILAPLAAIIAFIICILARRSPIVRHERVGWYGTPLAMLKFRTMWNRNEQTSIRFDIENVHDSVPAAKNGHDPRVTSRFARWCRRYSLDELPQLYHVARGEMSFVGPRPITRAELDRYYGDSADVVLSLRPGLTGLWQTMGRSRLSYARRRRLDLLLVHRASARLYFRILFESIPKVLSGADAC